MATTPSRSPSATSVRADAISRLKRAASLPRMKDGRRPAIPANGGAFSEGGRSEESSQRGADTPTYGYAERSHSSSDVPAALEGPREEEVDSGHENVVEVPPPEVPVEDDLPTPMPREDVHGLDQSDHDMSLPEPTAEVEPDEPEAKPEPEPLLDEPGPSEQPMAQEVEEERIEEEQQDEQSANVMAQQLSLIQQLQLQALLANLPAAQPPPSAFPAGLNSSHFAAQNAFQAFAQLRQPPNQHELLLAALLNPQQQQQPTMSPQQPRAYISPSSPLGFQRPLKSPASPMPTLDDLALAHQRGLFRSNSAAARTEAYSKLTGGRETPMTSPPSSVLGHASTTRLGRSNTVTGGERSAASNKMVGTLRRRREQQEDPIRAPSALDMTTSAGEESSVSVGQREERRSRRRRRHSSQSKSIVDDRDVPTNAASTPIAPSTPVPPEEVPPLPRPESLSSTSAANALRQSIERRGARDNFEYDYVDAKERSLRLGYVSSKPGTDVDTDTELRPVPQSPIIPPESEPIPGSMLGLPSTPNMSGLPYPNPPYLSSQTGPHDGMSHDSTGYMEDLPVYLTTGSMAPGRNSFPHTIASTHYSTPYKSPQNGDMSDANHRANTPGYDSAADSPWNFGAGVEFQGGLSDTKGRDLMDQIGDMGDDGFQTDAEGQLAYMDKSYSPGPDSAATVIPRDPSPPSPSPSPVPVMPFGHPRFIYGTPPIAPVIPWPEDSPPKRSLPLQREILSDISSVPPASTPHRSRTESMGLSDLETAITDGETTGREDRAKRTRSGSNFSDKVKTFLSHMSSKTHLRGRSNSISSRAERRERESNHSAELLARERERELRQSKEQADRQSREAQNRQSREAQDPSPESREKLEKRGSRERKHSLQLREGLLSGSMSTASLASQPSPISGKSVLDVTIPLPQGNISAMPPPSAEQIARYNSDKLMPFPGMLRLEQERSKFRTLSPPTSPTNMSFSPPTTSLSPPLDSTSTIKGTPSKLGTPSPGMTLLDLPATPTSAPATPGTLGERMGDRTLHYIDLGDNLLAGSEQLPTTRRGVQQWLRMKKPSSNGAIQKKSSLTDLLNSSGMLAESGTEKEEGTGLFGKLSLGRSLNKKPSRPRLVERQDSRPGTASGVVSVPPVPGPISAPGIPPAVSPPRIPLPPPPVQPPPPSIAVPKQALQAPYMPQPPAVPPAHVVASGSTTSNSLASLAAAASRYGERSNSQTALASLAAAAAIPDQPDGSHSSLASDPSGANSQTTDLSGSALSTPSVSQETSSASQPSLDSPPLIQQSQLKDFKFGGIPPPPPIPHAPLSPAFSPKPSPPRKLLLHSSVLQVVQGDRLKERHLFLFSDILVIAKPDPRASSNRDKGETGSLSRPLIVKSVVELRNLCIKPQEGQGETSKSDKHRSATLRTFTDEFAEDPRLAVDRLCERAGMQPDPRAIADVLFETPTLDKRQLGEYLCLRSSRHVLRAFIDRFGFEDVRIDIALRTFLLSLILPEKEECSDHLLNNFAARWWCANSRTIGFDRELSTRLVLAMIQLSDALHTPTFSSPARNGAMSPTRPRLSPQDWIETFRIRDPRQLVPELLLRAIYTGISRFRLAESLDSNSDSEVPAAMIPPRMKTRLTHGEPSERIHIRIPRPDRNFAIRLYGHGLKFDPEYLDFSNSTEQSFVIFPTTVGQKTIIFGREGVNSAFYTGVPLSKTVLVERAFMKNTFQLAFINHLGIKRKYLFSMDEVFRLTEWTTTLTSEITKRKSMDLVLSKDGERKAAADVVSFVMLREALLPREEKEPNSSAADTSAGSLSRIGTAKGVTDKYVPPGERSFTGQQIIQHCIQNSLLSGIFFRARPAKVDGTHFEADKRTPTPRAAPSLMMTPRSRPSGMHMI